VASQDYLARRGTLQQPADLATHDALVYSTVQGDARWRFTGAGDQGLAAAAKGPLRSNSLSALLAAARSGLGVAALPCYVAQESLRCGAVQPILTDWALPSQDIHAVYCSPRLVPAKVSEFIAWLQGQFRPSCWTEVH